MTTSIITTTSWLTKVKTRRSENDIRILTNVYKRE